MPADELVLVLPAAHFERVGAFAGFRPADDAYRSALLDPAVYQFRPRSEVETDPSFKQLIPYLVLTCRGRVFHYARGASGTEARLHAKRSVGIGGHIAEADAAGSADPYRAGMLRELAEEVTVGRYTETPFGFIFDPTTPVGRVHLGVVHRLELAEPTVAANEAAVADGGFADQIELWEQRDRFETWSQLVLERLA